jgi:hypothetical protein
MGIMVYGNNDLRIRISIVKTPNTGQTLMFAELTQRIHQLQSRKL